MEQQCMDTGVGGQHLPGISGRRIALEHNRDILFQVVKHLTSK
jgi:hypothetical protein